VPRLRPGLLSEKENNVAIELQKLTENDLCYFAGIEDPDAARKAEFQIGDGWDVMLIAEPGTVQVHWVDERAEPNSYGIYFNNPAQQELFLLYAAAVLRAVDRGDIHVGADFVTEAGMGEL